MSNLFILKYLRKQHFNNTKEINTTDVRIKFYEKELNKLRFNTLIIPLKGNE